MVQRKLESGVLFQLRMWATELQVGTASRHVCPICNGGSEGENSLSLKRVDSDRVDYKCFRASCNSYGRLSGGTGWVATQAAELPRPAGRVFSGNTRRMGDEWVSFLLRQFGVGVNTAARFGWLEDITSSRLVVPIRGPHGEKRGTQLRAKVPSMGPKSEDFRGRDNLYVGWFPTTSALVQGGQIVLVEDVFSAAKVSQSGFPAISLMGSFLSLEALQEVADFTPNRSKILLALDRDATDKAKDFVHRYGFLAGGRLRQLITYQDLKYVSEQEIVAMVKATCDA